MKSQAKRRSLDPLERDADCFSHEVPIETLLGLLKSTHALSDGVFEIQAALGEVSPDEGFTHRLDLKWGADKERVRRSIDIAVDL